jgi:hypothetical protein
LHGGCWRQHRIVKLRPKDQKDEEEGIPLHEAASLSVGETPTPESYQPDAQSSSGTPILSMLSSGSRTQRSNEVRKNDPVVRCLPNVA